ncbi:TonB-dependent receptor [Pseudoduganella aquatica]|uniref:TonB-dependent receptor n=1 Tax=Pseudoduganella aquatica TaxID=2660641 RepID=A0A7X4KNK2_9BURK|nr:TonB-dependent receptor [Pseudoduganella aquatica]MYN08950.1 TonB-dependent receptor [Pseudoduganella aquatica]
MKTCKYATLVAMTVAGSPALAQAELVESQEKPATAQAAKTAVPSVKAVTVSAPIKATAATAATSSNSVASAAPTDEIQVVNVVGERSTNRIDRQVYDIKNNPTTANASIGDILNNVPSVSVDANGTVALRGNDKVTIMVDGKRVQQFEGENRASAINSTAASRYESVQVINNPGAEFGSDGGGGAIINLISRRHQMPGGSGNASATAGAGGRNSGYLSGRYGWGYASLEGNASSSRSKDSRSSRTESESYFPTGITHTNSVGQSVNDGTYSRIDSTLRYNLNARDSLAAIANYNNSSNNAHSRSHYNYVDPRPGGGRQELLFDSASTYGSRGHEAGIAYERKQPDNGESIKLDVRTSLTQRQSQSASDVTELEMTIARANRDNRTRRDTTNRLLELNGAYEGGDARGFSSTGFKATNSVQTTDSYSAFRPMGSSVDTINRDQTNRFALEERVLALYVTHEWRLNALWSVKAGLRTEHTAIEAQHVTMEKFGDNSYLNWLPSAFASYKLGKASTVRLQYARRIQRPQATDLDPYVRKYGDRYESSGNPKLLPMKTDSLEAQYETMLGTWRTDLKAFVRRETDVIMPVLETFEDGKTRSTRVNGGARDNVGVEYSLRGKIIPSLQLALTGNLRRYEQLVYRLNEKPIIRRANAIEPRIALNYDHDPANQFSGTLAITAPRVFGETVIERTKRLDFTWSHRVDNRIRLNARVSDALQSVSPRRLTQSSQTRGLTEDTVPGRILYVGLSLPLGGVSGNASVRNAGSVVGTPAPAAVPAASSRP